MRNRNKGLVFQSTYTTKSTYSTKARETVKIAL